MKIGIVGAGKVGVTLGKYLRDAGISVTGYYSKTYESSSIAATFTNTKAYNNLESLIEVSDTLFLTTPDGAISETWDCMMKSGLRSQIVCHFSGSLSSNVFSRIESTKVLGCSIHPMYAFSDKFTSYQQFHNAYLTMEGNPEAIKVLSCLFQNLGHKVLTIQGEDKIKYHAAAAFASNYVIGLIETSLDLLQECGFSKEDSLELLAPMIQDNVNGVLTKGCSKALTGPIQRNDRETVERHLGILKGTEEEIIYRSLGKKLIGLAKEKNQQQDYSYLEKLLNGI